MKYQPRCFQKLELAYLYPSPPPSCRLLLQIRACISALTTDFCSGFLVARVSVAGGGGCWSCKAGSVVRGVPKGLMCSKTRLTSCSEHQTLALQKLHSEHRANEGKGRQL